LINPITAAAISRPFAKTFLHPNWQECANVTCPYPPIFIASRQLDERKSGDLWSRAVLFLIDKSILKANLGIAVSELRCAASGTFECGRGPEV
jgi:hypothetical protein